MSFSAPHAPFVRGANLLHRLQRRPRHYPPPSYRLSSVMKVIVAEALSQGRLARRPRPSIRRCQIAPMIHLGRLRHVTSARRLLFYAICRLYACVTEESQVAGSPPHNTPLSPSHAQREGRQRACLRRRRDAPSHGASPPPRAILLHLNTLEGRQRHQMRCAAARTPRCARRAQACLGARSDI